MSWYNANGMPHYGKGYGAMGYYGYGKGGYGNAYQYEKGGKGSNEYKSGGKSKLYQVCSMGCGGWEWEKNKKTMCRECDAPLSPPTGKLLVANSNVGKPATAADAASEKSGKSSKSGKSWAENTDVLSALEKQFPGFESALAKVKDGSQSSETVDPNKAAAPQDLHESQAKCQQLYKEVCMQEKAVANIEKECGQLVQTLRDKTAGLRQESKVLAEKRVEYEKAASDAQRVVQTTKAGWRRLYWLP